MLVEGSIPTPMVWAQEKGTGGRSRPGDDGIALLRAVAQRDARALASLYDRFAQPVMGLAQAVLRSAPDAEEVVAETFWQVWNRAGDYRPELGSPLCWLIVIARREAIDRLRTKHRHVERLHQLRLGHSRDYLAPGPSQAGGENEIQAAVRATLDRMNPRDRQLLFSAYFDGLTHQEIATALGLPLGTVKAAIRRGLLQLRAAVSAGRAP